MTQLDPDLVEIIKLALVILLPILPAYLLFKALPSTANVSGPLGGLTIKLGGAFAGYFAVVLLIFAQWDKVNPVPSQQTWEVNGRVVDDHGNPVELLSSDLVKLYPPGFQNMGGGWFKVTFYTSAGATAQTVDFPQLEVGGTINGKSYRPVPIKLGPDGKGDGEQDLRDDRLHTIKLKTVQLVVEPLYNPNSPAPTPTPTNGGGNGQ